jgi:signal transduction histidine kinase
MATSLRSKLLLTFLSLVVAVGLGTLVTIRFAVVHKLEQQANEQMMSAAVAVRDALAGGSDPATTLNIVAASTGFYVSLEPVHLGNVPAAADSRLPVVRMAVANGEVVVQASEDRVAHTSDQVGRTILIGAGIGLCGMLVLAGLFVRQLVRPLRSMSRSADQISLGNYDGPPPPDVGGELGSLSRAMVHLTKEIKARVSELTAQRDLLSAVIGRLVEGVVVVDHAGKFVMANSAAESLVDHSIPEPLQPLIAQALGNGSVDCEITVKQRTLLVSARRLANQGAIAVLYDVTRMRALENVRREFLSNAAHELRTPVTSILGYSETLMTSVNPLDGVTAREFVEIIHRNAERLTRMVADLMMLEKLESREHVVVPPVVVAVAPVVQHCVRTTQGVHKQAVIEIDVADDVTMLGSRSGLEHVVQNLVDNAVNYGGGSKVTVACKRIEQHIELTVSDRGPGIGPQHVPRLFERFYRVDNGRSRADGGTGLGLAIVKRQVESMGGTIEVVSRQLATDASLAHGTTFTITLATAPNLDNASDEKWRPCRGCCVTSRSVNREGLHASKTAQAYNSPHKSLV